MGIIVSHIHDYDEDSVGTPSEQSQAECRSLTSFENPPRILECPIRFGKYLQFLEGALQYGVC